MAKKRADYSIRRPRQLAVLGSPVRQAILDALAGAGRSCSVAQISALVGRPADSLYYHLRCLSKAGLVRRVASPAAASRGERHYEAPAAGVRVRYDFSSPTFRKNIVRMTSAMLRATQRDFSRAVHEPSACGEGKHRNTWAGRFELQLTREQLEHVNGLIRQLLDPQYAKDPSPQAKRYAVTIALAPLPDHHRRS